MTVEKKDLDWGSLDFGYRKTDYSYVANWKDGEIRLEEVNCRHRTQGGQYP